MAHGSWRFPGQVKGSAFIFETWVPKMSHRALTPGRASEERIKRIPYTPPFPDELQCTTTWSKVSEVPQKRTTQRYFFFKFFTGKFSIR